MQKSFSQRDHTWFLGQDVHIFFLKSSILTLWDILLFKPEGSSGLFSVCKCMPYIVLSRKGAFSPLPQLYPWTVTGRGRWFWSLESLSVLCQRWGVGVRAAPGLVCSLFLHVQVPPCRHMSTMLCYLSPGSLLSLAVGSPLWHQGKRWDYCLIQLAWALSADLWALPP